MTDPKFERLPKWAQRNSRAKDAQIERLTKELEDARALLKGGAPDERVVIDPYSDNVQFIPGNPQVKFQFKSERGWEKYFLVRLDDDNVLEIHGSASIVVHPRTGNGIRVEETGR